MSIVPWNMVPAFLAVGSKAHAEAYLASRVGPALAYDAFQRTAFDECPASLVSEIAIEMVVCGAQRRVGHYHVCITFAEGVLVCRNGGSSVHIKDPQPAPRHGIRLRRINLTRRGSAHVEIAQHTACDGSRGLHICVFVYGSRESAAVQEEVVMGFTVDMRLWRTHLGRTISCGGAHEAFLR